MQEILVLGIGNSAGATLLNIFKIFQGKNILLTFGAKQKFTSLNVGHEFGKIHPSLRLF